MLPTAQCQFNEQALQNITRCIKTGWISSQGEFVKQFEQRFAEYIGTEHAVAVSSGTAALHLALVVLGIKGKDSVLVPSFTFIATANVVVHTGATPKFCDVNANSWCISIKDTSEHLKPSTRAIIPVHLNGHPADMREIMALAMEHNLYVVEDACQALGTTYYGHRVGSLGHIGCFSFFANKHLTTGEGGMCVTNDDKLAYALRMYRDHGRNQNQSAYIHDVVGFNYRMTNLQAAVGISQIDTLDAEVTRRRSLYWKYVEALGNNNTCQAWHVGQSPWLYHHKLDSSEEAEEVIAELAKRDIEAKPFYVPCHMQPPYKHNSVSLPVSESLFGIMLPLHIGVTDEHINTIREVLVA